MRPWKLISVVSLMFIAGLLVTINDTTAQTSTPQPAPAASDCTGYTGVGQPGDSCVVLVHGLNGTNDLSLLVDGEETGSAVSFGSAGDYVSVPAGSHTLGLFEIDEESAELLTEINTELEPGAAYEIAVTGSGDDVTMRALPVDLSPVPAGSSSQLFPGTRVRVVHAVPDAPAVDVSVIGGDIAEKVFRDVEYGEVTEYIIKNFGTYQVKVEPSGSVPGSINLGSMTFDANTVYTFYAIGEISSGNLRPVTVAVPVDAAQTAAIATPEASPVASPVAVSGRQPAVLIGSCDAPTEESGFLIDNGESDSLEVWGEGGPIVGTSGVTPVLYASGTIEDVNLGQLFAGGPLALVVVDRESNQLLACGDLGGNIAKGERFWQSDTMMIALRELNGSGLSGVAILQEDTGILNDRIHIEAMVTDESA